MHVLLPFRPPMSLPAPVYFFQHLSAAEQHLLPQCVCRGAELASTASAAVKNLLPPYSFSCLPAGGMHRSEDESTSRSVKAVSSFVTAGISSKAASSSNLSKQDQSIHELVSADTAIRWHSSWAVGHRPSHRCRLLHLTRGGPLPPPFAQDNETRMKIMLMVKDGEITMDEALRRVHEGEGTEIAKEASGDGPAPIPAKRPSATLKASDKAKPEKPPPFKVGGAREHGPAPTLFSCTPARVVLFSHPSFIRETRQPQVLRAGQRKTLALFPPPLWPPCRPAVARSASSSRGPPANRPRQPQKRLRRLW